MNHPIEKDKKKVSREIGLEIATICGRHLLKLEHLHYGYWTADLAVDLANLPAAQVNYVKFLFSNIPSGVHSILDVGCGMGQIAKQLTDCGYKVDCVSPSAFLAENARGLLREKSRIFECFYEQLETENRYDLILFSESFQYIDPETAIQKTLSLLSPNGYMLICDVFKRDTQDKSPISGGHYLSRFNRVIAAYPFGLITDHDITEQTAPNRDIEDRLVQEVAVPVSQLLVQLMKSRYRMLSGLLMWVFRRKIEKMRSKYLSGRRTGEIFKAFKTYRLLLYKKQL